MLLQKNIRKCSGLNNSVIFIISFQQNNLVNHIFKVFDFELSEGDMNEIKKLNQNYRVYGVEVLNQHKFYPFHQD